MKYSIALIAPYKKLADLFYEVSRDLGRDLIIQIGDLEEGAKQAVELEEQGLDVVISRGGTAIAIKKRVTDLPVVDIQISGFDLIRILSQARQETDKVALVGFEPFTHGLDGIGSIMGLDLKVYHLKEEWYEHQTILQNRLQEVKEQGYNYLVGDNISVKIAKQLGMRAFLIRSGREAISRAIFEAERVAQARHTEMKKTQRIKSIIDAAYEGIISIDQRGVVDTFNPSAEKLFGLDSYKVIGEEIDQIIPEIDLKESLSSKYEERDRVWTIGNKKIVANIIPIEVSNETIGVVATCQEISRIQKMEQRIREELYLKGHIAEREFEDIIASSKIMQEIIEEARDYARIDSPLLIYGETGTGKEIFAQAIHNASPRKFKPFVAFNCAALPENLLESELFGYVKGAFTGAQEQGKPGFFEQAHQGTIFLDEVGEISPQIQVRLLRVLQERKVRRLGDDKIRPIDVRIIVATNKDLHLLVKEGKFREDLFYRINVLNLNVPSLRERKDDIPLLVNFFIKKFRHRLNKMVKGISADGMELLKFYNWPGNVRQLENMIERLVIRARGEYIMTGLIEDTIKSIKGEEKIKDFNSRKSINTEVDRDYFTVPRDYNLEEIEDYIIKQVISEENGNKTAAAERLGIGRTTLWRRLNQ